MSLASKKYYLILAPLFTEFSLTKVETAKPETKTKQKHKQSPEIKNKNEVEVQVTKMPIWKAKAKLTTGQWSKVD